MKKDASKTIVDVFVVVDRSGSMFPFQNTMNTALKNLVKELCKVADEQGLDLYFSLYSFANEVNTHVSCKEVHNVKSKKLNIKIKEGYGQTYPSKVLEKVADKAKRRYKKLAGYKRAHPLLVYFSDGKPSDTVEFENSAKKIKDEKVLNVASVGLIHRIGKVKADEMESKLREQQEAQKSMQQIQSGRSKIVIQPLIITEAEVETEEAELREKERIERKLKKFFEECIPAIVTITTTPNMGVNKVIRLEADRDNLIMTNMEG